MSKRIVIPKLGSGEKPLFVTARLRVWRVIASQSGQHIPRHMFIASRHDEDRPQICATALVTYECPFEPSLGYLDWIEVVCDQRRLGIGRELVAGIEKALGRELIADGVTPEGEAFCASLNGGVS